MVYVIADITHGFILCAAILALTLFGYALYHDVSRFIQHWLERYPNDEDKG